MKLSREKHGIEGVKGILEYIDAGGPDQIDGDGHEVMGETEDGHEACSTFSISQVAGEAFATIEHLERQRDQLRLALEWLHKEFPYPASESESFALDKARAALKATEEG